MAKGDFVIEGIVFTPADQETLRVLATEPLLARCRKLARRLSISEHAVKKRLDHLRQQTLTASTDELMEWIWARREQLERLPDPRHPDPLACPTDPLPIPQIALEGNAEFQLLAEALIGWADAVKRRDLLQKLSKTAALAAASPILDRLDPDEQERVALAIVTPSRVDAAVIDCIEEVLHQCMRQDEILGPRAVLEIVQAQRNLVLVMQAEAPDQLRPRLLSLFSKLSALAGWLSFNLNDFESAQCHHEEARRAAHEAQDAELAAFVLSDMSYVAAWRGLARVGIDHAVAAKDWARSTDNPLMHSYVADRAARAYAIEGERQACMEELEVARSELSAAIARGQRSRLLWFYHKWLLSSTESFCHLRLGDPRRAAEASIRSLALIDSSFVRNRALITVRLGVSKLREENIDEAARVLGDAADLAARNRSARLVDRLRAARAEIGPWETASAVRELDQRLAAHGLV